MLSANVDYSLFAEEVVLKDIEFLYSNADYQQQAFAIANKIVKRIKDNNVQLKIAAGLLSLIAQQKQD